MFLRLANLGPTQKKKLNQPLNVDRMPRKKREQNWEFKTSEDLNFVR